MSHEQAIELFAQTIAQEVFEKTARTVFHRLEHGPTSNNSPDPMTQQGITLHQWFQSLPDTDKHWTRATVIDCIWSAFHAVCYFFDSGAMLEVGDGKVVVFPVYLEAYETERQWSSRQLPSWRVRVCPVDTGIMLQDVEWEQMVSMARRNQWETLLGIEPAASSPATSPVPTEPFEVGPFNELRRKVPGTCLEVHLVPSGFVAQQVIPNYCYETAPGILLPVDAHHAIHRANPLLDAEQENSETGWLRLDREGAALLFLHALQEEVFQKAFEEVLGILRRGPSWMPVETDDWANRRMQGLHHWFVGLSELDRQRVVSVVRYTFEVAFHALCYFWDGGVHIRSECAEEVEFVVHLELHEGDLESLTTVHPLWSVVVCPAKGQGWDLHEAVGAVLDTLE